MTDEEEVDSLMRAIASAPALRPPAGQSLIGTQIGNYTITRQLGRGGMGVVYAAEHPGIGKKVAVKVLHDELAHNQAVVSRFFLEAKAVNDIHHENIVDIVDFGHHGERAYILMELLTGESLADRLERGPLPLAQAVHIVDQAARALAAAHAKGIVHRDIKPDNIFLTARSHDPCFVKVLDFGIVKLTGSDRPAWKTQTGALIGTPLYMSPEQCAGRRDIDARSDIYSLGLVLYEMLSGRAPFARDSVGSILRAQMGESPPPLTDVPGHVAAAVTRCLQKAPFARFTWMDELRQALSVSSAPTVVRPGPVAAPAPPKPSGIGHAPPRSRGPLLALLGALALAALIATVALWPRTHATPTPTPATPPPVERVEVVIQSSPQGAAVRRQGNTDLIGRTPLKMKVRKDEPPFEVVVMLEGLQTEMRIISPRTDREVMIVMGKQKAPTPAKALPPRPALPRPKPPDNTPPTDKPQAPATLDDRLL